MKLTIKLANFLTGGYVDRVKQHEAIVRATLEETEKYVKFLDRQVDYWKKTAEESAERAVKLQTALKDIAATPVNAKSNGVLRKVVRIANEALK